MRPGRLWIPGKARGHNESEAGHYKCCVHEMGPFEGSEILVMCFGKREEIFKEASAGIKAARQEGLICCVFDLFEVVSVWSSEKSKLVAVDVKFNGTFEQADMC